MRWVLRGDAMELEDSVGFVAGFAERLIPNIVRQTADKIESAVGTPVQAARNSPNRVGGKPPNCGEEKPA